MDGQCMSRHGEKNKIRKGKADGDKRGNTARDI